MAQLDKASLARLAQRIQKAQAANGVSLLTQSAYGNIGGDRMRGDSPYLSSTSASPIGGGGASPSIAMSISSTSLSSSTGDQKRPQVLDIVTKEEVYELFQIYFESLNPHCCLLLSYFHTPAFVCSRSPFLFTVICAIAARFHPSSSRLHHRLIPLAHQMVFAILESGYRSVEIVQGCLLLTMWGAGHTENYEQERTWLLLGLAIRVATDINLNRRVTVDLPSSSPSPSSSIAFGSPTSTSTSTLGNGASGSDVMVQNVDQEAMNAYKTRVLEVRNRERTWLVCFILDRSLSAQMGKPYTIIEDSIIRSISTWWRHPLSEPPDSGIATYVEFQRCISRCLEFIYSGTSSVSGMQTNCDYLVVIRSVETQLTSWNNEWQQFRSQLPSSQDSSITYRKLVAHFYFQYGLLLVNSFGLQNALDNAASKLDAAHFFARCHSAASQCAIIVRDELVPRGFLKHSPDSHFVLISYAVLTLLKLSLSEFCKHVHDPERTVSLVRDVVKSLEAIAVGPQHTPALYATFLRALIDARPIPTTEGAQQNRDTLGVCASAAGYSVGDDVQNLLFPGAATPLTKSTPTELETMSMSTDNLRQFDFGLGLGLDLDSSSTFQGNDGIFSSSNEASILSGYLNTVPETLYLDSSYDFDHSQSGSSSNSNSSGHDELADIIMAGFASTSHPSLWGGVQTPRLTSQLFPSSLGEMGPPLTTVRDSSSLSAMQAHSAAAARGELDANMISVDSILSPNFWDNILIPGFSSTFEGLSGGMVYGAGGSGLITPRANSPGPS